MSDKRGLHFFRAEFQMRYYYIQSMLIQLYNVLLLQIY